MEIAERWPITDHTWCKVEKANEVMSSSSICNGPLVRNRTILQVKPIHEVGVELFCREDNSDGLLFI